MEAYYEFAGLELVLTLPGRDFREHAALIPFRRETPGADPIRFCFSFEDKLSPPEGVLLHREAAFLVYGQEEGQVRYLAGQDWEQAHTRICLRGNTCRVELERSRHPICSGKTVLNALMAEHLLARRGKCVFHACYIRSGDGAILFTAPSGTGKSTQGELWKQLRDARILNGDRAVLAMEAGIPTAHGIPFAGSSSYCRKESLPIRAIVYLSQAPETTIHRLRGREAFFRLWEGVSVNTWDRQDMELVSGLIRELSLRVPVYHLACTPDESAVRALEQELRKQESV